MAEGFLSFKSLLLAVCLPALAGLPAGLVAAEAAHAQPVAQQARSRQLATWSDIDNLRMRLEASGARVVQRDCGSRGLQGLYHQPSGTIVICRVHRDPQAVWNTLAHEATHRMQACAGRPLTRPSHHPAMARTLAAWAPEELRSLMAYPPGQQVAELEARYTARLAPAKVLMLFQRYCGGAPVPSSVLSLSPTPSLSLSLAPSLALAQVPPGLPLQLTSLAAATCLEARGQLRADQRALLLQLQGRYWGWPRYWEQQIDPRRVVALIQRQGGCTNLLRALRNTRIQPPRPGSPLLGLPQQGLPQQGYPQQGLPQPGRPRPGSTPRSEVEGFGLAPYR